MKITYYMALAGVAGGVLVASPAQASRTDSRIESAAKNSYVFKTYLKDDSIEVKSDHGVVTLTGSVADEGQKAMAVETVSNLPGVVSVNNELTVNGGNAAVDSKASGSDAMLELKIKSSLLFDRGVSADTKVVARDGVVTLYGPADNQAQKDRVTQCVRDVDGVRDVHNEMSVAAEAPVTGNPGPANGEYAPRTIGEKIDDASVTAEAKVTLVSHSALNGSHISVTTRRGVVMLDGTAQTQAQKDLADRLVNDLKGVNRVVDHINVP